MCLGHVVLTVSVSDSEMWLLLTDTPSSRKRYQPTITKAAEAVEAAAMTVKTHIRKLTPHRILFSSSYGK